MNRRKFFAVAAAGCAVAAAAPKHTVLIGKHVTESIRVGRGESLVMRNCTVASGVIITFEIGFNEDGSRIENCGFNHSGVRQHFKDHSSSYGDV